MEKQIKDKKKGEEEEATRKSEEHNKQENEYSYDYEQHQTPNMSSMEATTKNAYGGGMYALEKADERPTNPPASITQSADGPDAEPVLHPKHPPPPSSGDRDTDITGQSYIQ